MNNDAKKRSTRSIVLLRLFAGVLLFVVCVCALHAQVETATVVGTVRDSTGAVIRGANVSVTSLETNISKNVVTNDVGEYVVTQLKPGTYSVIVEREGFKKVAQSGFRLNVNQVARMDMTLEPGSVMQQVEVVGAEPLVESDSSSIGQVIQEDQVHELPLNGRNFVQLAYLSPGVNAGPQGAASTVPQQGGIPENERSSGAIQVNGLTATNNNFLLNGFDNNEQQIGFEIIQPSVDAIQEFKVQTNNFGADIGRGGAVVNVILKSGTNKLHGSVYEFLRNSALDAKNYFDDPNSPIPPYKQNQFGATIGGPIIKNRTFFFGDFEGLRIRQALTQISTVPNMLERGGDFSDLLVRDASGSVIGGQIFNPLTTDQSTNARQAFGGNVIPPGMLDLAALKVVNIFPKPNLPGDANNFLYNPLLTNTQNSFDIRIDHQLTSRNSLFGIFSFGNVTAHRPDPMPGLAGGGAFSGNIEDKARAIGISDVHTFSPKVINEVKLSYFRYVVNAVQNFAGKAVATDLGIPGINDPNNLIATGGLPWIDIAGFSGLGNNCCFPEFLHENNYQLQDAVTYIRGRHSFKTGVDLRRRDHGFFQALNPQGLLTFDPQFTADLNNMDANPGSSLASFLLGYPISGLRDGQKGSYGMRWAEFSAYFMDDWRVSSKLTLNVGLRWDLFTPMAEQHNRLANFDFTTGKFVAPGMPGVSRSGNVMTNYANFAPRFGFAYTPRGNKTVLRGGFGIFYDQQANQNDAELAYNPTGLFFSQTFNNAPNTNSPSFTLSNGFPAPIYPTVDNPSGRASAALFNNATTYIEEWNLNLERELMKNFVLQIGYVGTHGVHLAHLANLNQPVQPLDSNFSLSDNYGRPYYSTVPDIAAIRTEAHDFSSISHGLQVRLEKRSSSGWSFLNAYTWQHTIGQTEENEYLEPQDTHNLRAERGDNGPDHRHQFTSAWSYELPLGPGKRFLTGNGASRWLAGGWQLNGIIGMYSGQAFTPLLSTDYTNTGSGTPRPDVIGNPYDFSNAVNAGCPSNQQTIQCWYNPAAFAIPSLAPGQSFARQFGNAGRGTLRGPAVYNVDFSVFKDFKLRENTVLQFRTEIFNLFNTPQFAIPSAAIDAPGAGAITSTVHSSRQIQFALKLSF